MGCGKPDGFCCVGDGFAAGLVDGQLWAKKMAVNATEEKKSLLAAWKKYRVLLNRVDTSTAPDIEWPTNPVRE